MTPTERAAWALAEADVQIERIAERQVEALDALHAIETEALPRCANASMRTFVRLAHLTHLAFPIDRKVAQQFIARLHRERDAALEELRLLDRYAREADARRRKAFRHWIEVSSGSGDPGPPPRGPTATERENPKNRNKTNHKLR